MAGNVNQFDLRFSYDPSNHPAFGMVRGIMYLLILTTAFLHVKMAPYVLRQGVAGVGGCVREGWKYPYLFWLVKALGQDI